MRTGRGRVRAPGPVLAGHRVRHIAHRWASGGTSWRLVGKCEPSAEVAGLCPSCLIPGDLDGPQEPEPAQEVHRIGALRRVRTARCLQVLQKRRHRGHRITSGIDDSDGLPQVATGNDPARPRHDQHREITFFAHGSDRSQLRISSHAITPVSGTGSSVNRSSSVPLRSSLCGHRPRWHRNR